MAGIAQALVPLLTKGLEVAQPHIAKAAQDGATSGETPVDAAGAFVPATVIGAGKSYTHGTEQKTASGVVVCDTLCSMNSQTGQIMCPAKAKCVVVRNALL